MLKNLILLSGFSAFVVICIVGLNIYHGITLSSLPASTQKHVAPITPTFDKKSLEELKKRSVITVSLQEKSGVISVDTKEITLLTPTPSKTISASTSATPTISIPPAIIQP